MLAGIAAAAPTMSAASSSARSRSAVVTMGAAVGTKLGGPCLDHRRLAQWGQPPNGGSEHTGRRSAGCRLEEAEDDGDGAAHASLGHTGSTPQLSRDGERTATLPPAPRP